MGLVKDLRLLDISVNVTNSAHANGRSTGSLSGSLSGRVERIYVAGTIKGFYSVGGIIGNAGTISTITNCRADVTVSGSYNIGGLVGDHWGVIKDSFATGTVTPATEAGGLAGHFTKHSSGWLPKIINSFSTCSVSGSTDGGLVGYFTGALFRNSFWHNTGTNPSTCTYSSTPSGCSARTTLADFYDSHTEPIQSWDLTDVWNASGSDFPTLK